MLCQLGVSNFHDKYAVCKKKKSLHQYTKHALLKIQNILKNIWLVHVDNLNSSKKGYKQG